MNRILLAAMRLLSTADAQDRGPPSSSPPLIVVEDRGGTRRCRTTGP
jgi:hypothetical protein